MTDFYYSDITVHGFHGCHSQIKKKLLAHEEPFTPSQNKYDWLGRGVYFWENDPFRAYAWAQQKHGANGTVIGATIRLGHCFDLSTTSARIMLAEAYRAFAENARLASVPLPVNRHPPLSSANPADRVLRYLDQAVIQYTFEKIFPDMAPPLKFDSIRAPFQEGFELYKGSGFRQHDHIHLCIRDSSCINNLFDPLL